MNGPVEVGAAPVVQTLIGAAVSFSRAVSSFLARCEQVLELGDNTRQVALEDLDAVSLLEALRAGGGTRARWRDAIESALDEMPDLLVGSPRTKGRRAAVASKWERRLARLALHAWREQVRPLVARRPDVLALTCALLTNPAAPHTHDVVRASVVMLLRSLYGIGRDTESLQALRDTHSSLSRRLRQQKRRVLKDERGVEPFLLDLLAMEGWINRAATGEHLSAYYEGFDRAYLGVEDRLRAFGPGTWPEIHGPLPDFPSLLSLAFGQPTAVRGLDEVTGGLMIAVADPAESSSRGVVTLFTGPPGSGKTSLSLAIASRMADLGSQVSYLATEEDVVALRAKLTAMDAQDQLARLLFPEGPARHASDFRIVAGRGFDDLSHVVDQLADDLQRTTPDPDVSSDGHRIDVVFPVVVVIDSLTALLGASAAGGPLGDDRLARRKVLADLLERFRALGVALFLVGGDDDAHERGMAYLVDNHFSLGLDARTSERHPVRTLTVEKTRLQVSYRGRHAFHLSRADGCVVNPSIHAVLRLTKHRRPPQAERRRRAVLSAGTDSSGRISAITLRDRAHSVVWGWGSAGKAKLGLWLALEPRVGEHPVDDWKEYVSARAARGVRRQASALERRALRRSRVLVVTFLHTRPYYLERGRELLMQRFGCSVADAYALVEDVVDTVDVYPGYVDPETLLARIARTLRGARFDGRPFTSVMVDGIHNLLLQFPLLADEELVWPALFRMLRSENVSTVSTFTFFSVVEPSSASQPFVPDDNARLLCQLLVSSCNYSFRVSSHSTGARVVRTGGSDEVRGEPATFDWDPRRCTATIVDDAPSSSRAPARGRRRL